MADFSTLPCPVLIERQKSGIVRLPNGHVRRFGAQISPVHADALYGAVLKARAQNAIEIGMAQGASTLAMLTALSQTGGSLISVDPYVDWNSGLEAALCAVDEAGFSRIHTHLRTFSHLALPQLLAEGQRFDFAYIDGNHQFSYVFVDFFYIDKLLDIEGIVGFNDVGHLDVARAVKFVEGSGRYERIDVGLRPDYKSRSPLITAARYLLRRSREDRYYKKKRN